jgi:hypothetical protein
MTKMKLLVNGGVISANDLVTYERLIGTAPTLIAAILFGIAQFIMRPRVFNKMQYLERVRATFIPLKNEEAIFVGEMKKLKLYRTLWGTILALLFFRVFIGFFVMEV